MNLLLMEYDVLCIVDCVDLLNLKGRTAPKKLVQTEFNEDTKTEKYGVIGANKYKAEDH